MAILPGQTKVAVKRGDRITEVTVRRGSTVRLFLEGKQMGLERVFLECKSGRDK